MIPLPLILGAASLIGKIAGKGSSNRAAARVDEATLNAQRDSQALQRAQIEQNNARQNLLTDETFRTDERGAAVRGGLLAGLDDYHVTRPTGVPSGMATGGLRPSAIVNGKTMGADFQKDALARLLAGSALVHDTPALTPIPEAGKFDKFLNIVDLIGSGADIASSLGLGKKKIPTTPGYSNIKFTMPRMANSGIGVPYGDE